VDYRIAEAGNKMKKTAPWDSTFSDKLAQSQDAKNARLKKIAGYDLYILFLPRKKEIIAASYCLFVFVLSISTIRKWIL
jgi:hypothetical protein